MNVSQLQLQSQPHRQSVIQGVADLDYPANNHGKKLETMKIVYIGTFTGQVTIVSPVKIIERPLWPAIFQSGSCRLVFNSESGQLSRLIKGESTPFAEFSDGKLHKLTYGWRDTTSDYIAILLHQELWRNSSSKSGTDLSDYQNHYILSAIVFAFNGVPPESLRFNLRPSH